MQLGPKAIATGCALGVCGMLLYEKNLFRSQERICIVGSGVIGSSAAYHFSKHNSHVTLLDTILPIETENSYVIQPVHLDVIRHETTLRSLDVWKHVQSESQITFLTPISTKVVGSETNLARIKENMQKFHQEWEENKDTDHIMLKESYEIDAKKAVDALQALALQAGCGMLANIRCAVKVDRLDQTIYTQHERIHYDKLILAADHNTNGMLNTMSFFNILPVDLSKPELQYTKDEDNNYILNIDNQQNDLEYIVSLHPEDFRVFIGCSNGHDFGDGAILGELIRSIFQREDSTLIDVNTVRTISTQWNMDELFEYELDHLHEKKYQKKGQLGSDRTTFIHSPT